MKWCERCGRWFTPRNREVKRAAVLIGAFVDPSTTVCDDCLTYGEKWDEGVLIRE